MNSPHWLDECHRNFTYSLRSIGRNAGFTTVAVLSLALGIGANTAIFHLLDRLVLTPVAVRDPGSLLHVVLMTARGPYYRMSYVKYQILRDNFNQFENLFGWSSRQFELMIGDRTEPLQTHMVTGNYFTSLGLQPSAGRLVQTEDDRPGGPPVAVISYRLSQTMSGSKDAIGQTIALGTEKYEVVGVAPRGFNGLEQGSNADVFIPFHAAERFSPAIIRNEGAMAFYIFARLKNDVRLEDARIAVKEGWTRFSIPRQKLLGDRSRPEYLTLEDGSRGFSTARVEFTTAVTVLMCLVGIVFLIACANLATLLLVRGMVRSGETGIRLALGASRWQLIRQWMTECMLLAAIGGIAGTFLARWITEVLLLFVPERDRIWLQFHTDYRVLAVSAALTLTAGFLFGFLPAIRSSRVSLHSVVKESSRSMAHGRNRLAQAFLVGQLAAALVLATGALLFARTLYQLNSMSGGFDRQAVAYGFIAGGVPRERFSSLVRDAVEQLAGSPTIASASLSGGLPFVWGSGGWGWVNVPGYTPADGEDNVVYSTSSGPGYFRTMGIRFIAGRDFEERDGVLNAPPVVIVSESFVQRYLSGRDPIGQTFSFGKNAPVQIIGVVTDTKGATMREPQRDLAYYPVKSNGAGAIVVRMKQGVPAAAGEGEIRSVLSSLAKGARIQVGTLDGAVQNSLGRDRLLAQLSAGFGLLGVLLASIGLYGATAYSVRSRTREIGLRIALGASRTDVIRLVFGQIFAVTVTGILLGAPIAMVSARLIKSLLFGVSAVDPIALSLAAAALILVSLFAGWKPAWRAMRLDPAQNLRHE